MNSDVIIREMTVWLEKAVIGLNLCPFASLVHKKKQIKYVVSQAQDTEDLLRDLIAEIKFLSTTDANKVDTTLLIHPYVLNEFLDFNDFLDIADAALLEMEMDHVLQIASFHPQYQFADTDSEDITNYTNRSPYPCLHLLREASMSRAVDSGPPAEDIFLNNIRTMKNLGLAGWKKLFSDK